MYKNRLRRERFRPIESLELKTMQHECNISFCVAVNRIDLVYGFTLEGILSSYLEWLKSLRDDLTIKENMNKLNLKNNII